MGDVFYNILPTKLQPSYRLTALAIALFLSFCTNSYAADAIKSVSTQEAYSCIAEIQAAEKQYHIPRGLLYAVGMTESGKYGYPWPWTLNVNGRAIYANSYYDAAIYMFDQDGSEQTDMAVGCMQIHMRYHRKGFADLHDALQPKNNVQYAAKFLKDLKQKHGNWTHAVAHYHATQDAAQNMYVCRVLETYREINQLQEVAGESSYCASERLANR